MNKIIITISFAAMLLAQWFVPGQMIYKQEEVIREGVAYKFRTQPLDPSDPFRGKYIYLNYEVDKAFTKDTTINYNDMYVYIAKDSAGFAIATHASKTLDKSGQNYVKVRSHGIYNDTVRFNLPFNVYYMDENKAYDAEVVVRQARRDTLINNCYGLVYIKEGRSVLADVFVDDISIKDYVEEIQK